MVKIWKDKEGRWISPQEFGKRWKQGIEGITPMQNVKSQIFFTCMILFGLIGGIFVSILAWKTLWWLSIILIAAYGNTYFSAIALYQKYIQLKRIKEMIEQDHNQITETEVKKDE